MEIRTSDKLKRARETLREELKETERRRGALEGNKQPDIQWLKMKYAYLVLEIEMKIANISMRIEDEEVAERIRDLREKKGRGAHERNHSDEAESA